MRPAFHLQELLDGLPCWLCILPPAVSLLASCLQINPALTSPANSLIHILKRNQTESHIETRMELPVSLAREWSFERLNSSEKGRKIKRWAQKIGYSCPGTLCNHVKFEKLDQRKIAFGHIVSQEWTHSFTFLLDKKDHPDNLYLTCQQCNSSLSDNFPDTELRKEIEERGTIGDWLRKYVSDIRSA